MELSATDPRCVAWVDLNDMTVTLNSGDLLPITRMFDEDGDETEDRDAAVRIVAGSDGLGWWSVPLDWVEEFN